MHDAPELSIATAHQTADRHQDHIGWVSAKLCALHDGLAHERDSRFEQLQGKMKELDERVSASQDSVAKKFTVLKSGLVDFQRELDLEQKSREGLAQGATRDVARVHSDLEASLRSEQEARRSNEAKILHIFDQKTNELREEIGRAGVRREANQANLRRYLEVDVPKLFESIKEEVESRESSEKRMLKKAMDEVSELQAAVLAERRAREDTEEAMLRMMEDVVAKMMGDLASDRRERERTEEMLQELLNATCHRLQVASRSL